MRVILGGPVACVGMCLMVVPGCQRDSFERMDVADPNFSTPADYEAYDHEMAVLSEGQAEQNDAQ